MHQYNTPPAEARGAWASKLEAYAVAAVKSTSPSVVMLNV
jgi:hypothetical protein